MQTVFFFAVAYAAALDPIPKSTLPPVTDEMWKQSAIQLKHIGLAMLNYESAYGCYPQNVTDKNGKALLSWRVLLLPYLEQDNLYRQFKLDEPWDSDHNKKLIEKMPKVYQPVRFKVEMGQTLYQGFVGNDTIFRKGKPVKLIHVTDGLSNTAMVITAGKPVLWTKPDDIPFDASKDLPKLGADFDGEFNLLMGDGSVKKIKKNFDASAMKIAIQMSDGNVYNHEAIEK